MTKKLLLLCALLPSLLFAQHSIKGTFTPVDEFNYAVLYQVTPTTSTYIDNTEIKADGSFSFNLAPSAKKGIYRIVYALPQEDYNFDVIYNANEDIELTFNFNDGVRFTNSPENKLLTSYNKSIALIQQSINAFYSKSNPDKKGFHAVFDVLKNTQNEYEKAAKNTIALNFIKASKPYIPTDFENAETYSKNLKANYFKHIDFSNEVLQSSNFLMESTLNYVFNFIYQKDKNTAYKNNVDHAVKAIGDQSLIKKTLLTMLWDQFATLKNETVANYISDTYLLEIAKSENNTELIEQLTIFKNISIGSIAPNFLFTSGTEEQSTPIKLSEYNASQHYILVFWSSMCSHCLAELPQLENFIKSFKKEKLQVIAFALEDKPEGWKEKISEFPDFKHVYGEGKWDNKTGNDYGVEATPTYFILDKDKKIRAKPEDFEAVKTYFIRTEKR